jgi:hypothetical protein
MSHQHYHVAPDPDPTQYISGLHFKNGPKVEITVEFFSCVFSGIKIVWCQMRFCHMCAQLCNDFECC